MLNTNPTRSLNESVIDSVGLFVSGGNFLLEEKIELNGKKRKMGENLGWENNTK